MNDLRAISLAVVLALGFCQAGEPLDPAHAAKMAKGLEVFKQSVRQVLNDSCLKCHGGEKTKGDFDLVTREDLLKGGKSGKVIVPGDSKASLFYKLITHQEEPPMPHKEPKLPAAAIAKIGEWIDLGAPYDKPLLERSGKTAPKEMLVTDKDRAFWSFKPLAKPEPPPVKNSGWSKSPIDRFILAKLEEKGLAPNPPAERRKLIRRVYFDLLGLPPPPEEIEAFVADSAPDAYAKLVDRLLESPHFGERWARYWLDVARFAESHGFEQDYDRPHAYHFRDFVIQAFNQDLPYDTFVKWQLAGDEFAPDNPLAMMATGFIGAGVFPTQITANEVERTRYDALDDMAATTGTAMLGLTIGCARCHDHKYDPLPVKDYYRLVSTFTTTVRSNVEIDFNSAASKEAKAKFAAEHAPFVAALEKFEKEQLPARMNEWLKTRPKDDSAKPAWTVLDIAEFKSEGGATFTKQEDGSLLASGKNPDFDTYTFTAHTTLKGITAIRLDALAHSSFVKGGPGRAANGNIALTDFKMTASPKTLPASPPPAGGAVPAKAAAVKLINPKATFEQKGLPVKATIDADKKSAWAVDPQFGKDHAAIFETEGDIGSDGGTTLTFTLKFENNTGHNIGRPRLSVTTAPRPVGLDGDARPQAVIEALAAAGTKELTEKQRAALLGYYKTLDPDWKKLNAAVQEHLKQAPKPALTQVMVCSEGFLVKPIRHHTQGGDYLNETHFLKRGDTNQKLGVAAPGFLQVLTTAPEKEARWQAKPPEGCKSPYRRLALANWITDTQAGAGHLLARVIVNRLWHHHFGKGIVATPNDFGFQGERPTNPELLDWLANQLIAGGWKLKPIHRQIMNSAVYMQASAPLSSGGRGAGGEGAATAHPDPGNTLFWRYDRHRLEAESIRDAMLSVAGVLDKKMFGPGSLDEGHKRRSIYFMVKRSKLIPMMQLFDAPEPTVSIGGRASTTIAPQALLFLNNPHVRGYARSFAARCTAGVSPASTSADFVARAYNLALGRQPGSMELSDGVSFINAQLESYRAEKKPEAQARELALTDFCQVLFSLNEFVYVE